MRREDNWSTYNRVYADLNQNSTASQNIVNNFSHFSLPIGERKKYWKKLTNIQPNKPQSLTEQTKCPSNLEVQRHSRKNEDRLIMQFTNYITRKCALHRYENRHVPCWKLFKTFEGFCFFTNNTQKKTPRKKNPTHLVGSAPLSPLRETAFPLIHDKFLTSKPTRPFALRVCQFYPSYLTMWFLVTLSASFFSLFFNPGLITQHSQGSYQHTRITTQTHTK